ncbi:helix-turn-helix domain-containing protein [candidate division WOR-3 bacterium]|uniref:Helix-turn-helix domain-containing protein n=1 Tax=candidate division WOR-3 bacterium TaxID=2052148 RepID=A0A9D5QDY4_UNCW3|nr:helix-turn-helix domain-containing protein [candidate division WOR-3 bacterium]MBD3365531.1 helix-turn-helix domain-containing protein [candidate division WOR-3 bacterium]
MNLSGLKGKTDMHLFRIREAAALLHCHPYSLYSAIYQGRIKALKFKGNLRVPADEVERLIQRGDRLKVNLSVAEVGRILACSQSTVLRLIRGRKLKAERIGKRYSVSPKRLEDYVLSMPDV